MSTKRIDAGIGCACLPNGSDCIDDFPDPHANNVRLGEICVVDTTCRDGEQMPGIQYWKGLLDWIKETVLKEGKISLSDLEILQVIDEPSEILRAIKKTVIL